MRTVPHVFDGHNLNLSASRSPFLCPLGQAHAFLGVEAHVVTPSDAGRDQIAQLLLDLRRVGPAALQLAAGAAGYVSGDDDECDRYVLQAHVVVAPRCAAVAQDVLKAHADCHGPSAWSIAEA